MTAPGAMQFLDAAAVRARLPWPVMLAESWMRMQRLQWDALAAWQRSFATFNEDFWEQWACRYAGGIPIDA